MNGDSKKLESVKNEIERLLNEKESSWTELQFVSKLQTECSGKFTLRILRSVEIMLSKFDGDIWELADVLFAIVDDGRTSDVTIASLVVYVFYNPQGLSNILPYLNKVVIITNYRKSRREIQYS